MTNVHPTFSYVVIVGEILIIIILLVDKKIDKDTNPNYIIPLVIKKYNF